MDEKDKKKIRQNFPVLCKDIDFDMVVNGLIAKEIFQPHHYETFQSKPSTMQKNREMLMCLETRGPRAFTALVESLVDADQMTLARKLGYELASNVSDTLSQTSAVSRDETLTGPFGLPKAQEEITTGSAVIDSPTQLDASARPDIYPDFLTDDPNIYRMRSKPRGIAVIINNTKFDKKRTRNGSDVDRDNLKSTFDKLLGFSTLLYENLAQQKTMELLRHLSKMKHATFDCFILAILSHGTEGGIYTTDEQCIKIDDIIKFFSAEECPDLAGKPKLFFIQACRGVKYDSGVDATDSKKVGEAGASPVHHQAESSSRDASGSSQHEAPEAEYEQGLVDQMVKLELEMPDSFASARGKIPSQSDMLLAYATVPGYVSWRNSAKGSWFIQALTEVLREYADKEDLLSMTTLVNNKVATDFESFSGRNKQIPGPVNMLRKKLYFFPNQYAT